MEVTISIDDKIFVNIFIITRKDKCKMKSSTFPYLSVKNFINEEKQHFCHDFSIFISITPKANKRRCNTYVCWGDVPG